ncbi:MAG: hypothetical protein INF97_10810 [Roseomonas sp.]|nr:hypothetical protein [Roseomonas sp.]
MAKKSKRKNIGPDKRSKREFYSSLDSHQRQGGKLLAPFTAKLGTKISWANWRDGAMHDVLWATLIRGNLSQEEALHIFRQVVAAARENKNRDAFKETFITHSVLSVLPAQVFDEMLAPVLRNTRTLDLLRPLLFFRSLPDRHHWARHLSEPDPALHSDPLMRAVASCLDHQSQEATDIRWFKLTYFAVVCDRIRLAMDDKEAASEQMEEWRLYPNYGDQHAVRPSIRAAEMMLRSTNEKSGQPIEVPVSLEASMPPAWHDGFWQECLKATPCILPPIKKPERINCDAYREQFLMMLSGLSEHFIGTLKNTNVDARRDSAFGLVMYAIVLCLGLVQVHQRAEGRIILRSIVEIFITIRFLSHHDNPTLWAQYRNHGNGQAKLAFLKNLRSEDLPNFVSLEELESYASEDIWQEFQDIDLKSWSDRNLRAMAAEAGIKDIYDKYYDWSSGYIHANWASIRDTIFTTCLNPLHRFHRIPFIPRLNMPSALPDGAKLVNGALDVIAQLFPPLKMRIKHPRYGSEGDGEGQGEAEGVGEEEPEQSNDVPADLSEAAEAADTNLS